MSLKSSFMNTQGPREALAYLSGVIESMGRDSKLSDYQDLSDAIMVRAKQLDFNAKFIDLDAEAEQTLQAQAACSE